MANMEKVNGKWIAPEHFDSEEERKKAMNGWRRSFYMRPFDQTINSDWLKLDGFHSSKPIT